MSQGHDAQWPPQSPQQALLSSPSGRRRYQNILNRPTSPSPSPRAARRAPPPTDEMELDEEDDEETLQLKLQELQARLKLKKLQNAKAKDSSASPQGSSGRESAVARSRALNGQVHPMGIPAGISTGRPRDENIRPGSEPAVQVPASPVKQGTKILDPVSPRRVQLGIDKGLKAKDISLKRAPHIRASTVQHDSYLRTSRTSETAAPNALPNRPLTFSERLARSRVEEEEAAEKKQRAQKARSKGFGVGKDEMDAFKRNEVKVPEEKLGPPIFSREEVLSKDQNSKKGAGEASAGAQDGGESFEPFSSLHLSRRFLPQRTLARNVSGKKIMTIKDLLRDVKAPDFSLPDVEQDIVAFGIVAKKSEPRAHKPGTNKKGEANEDRGKYMVMNLCDLEYEVDMFLFNTGFERFWKLTEGTVVAVLNPNVMPPPPGRQDTGRFSLVINSDEDTIIEIGSARDLGYCKSMKRDSSTCNAWINKKRTEFCEFHTNEALRKTRGQRAEIASSAGSEFAFGSKPKKGGNGKGKGREWLSQEEFFDKKNRGNNYDWESKSRYFINQSMSSSDLIDGKGFADRKEREERLQKKLVKEEKEREIAKKLGGTGNAAGREYMQRNASRKDKNLSSSVGSSQATTLDPSDALAEREARHQAALKSLNLSSRDRQIHLGSIKRKRPDSSNAGSTTGKASSTPALGWGGGLKDKLTRMREGEKLRKEAEADAQPPVRKKTRFVTEKGIREAGRESLGVDLDERMISLDDDDDDELVIVK